MATEKEASLHCCASDPNFAVICSFLEQFSAHCGVTYPTFKELQDMLEDTQEVSQVLIDLHIKLLRKARKSFTADKWEKALARFCHTYSQQDGWELERFGYKKARLAVKVKLLKVLLETQFDVNAKFKSEVNKFGAKDLRLEPLGRDQNGFQYWCHFDKSAHVRIYREDVDEETWELVASDRDGLVQLIDSLSNGEGQLELNSILNEDSTSQEIEKPITDTGQENDDDDENDDEDTDDEEEEEIEDEEEVEEEEEEQEVKEKSLEAGKVESNKQKSEEVKINSIEKAGVPNPINKDKAVSERVNLELSVKNNVSLTGVDLSVKSDSKSYAAMPTDYYSSVPETNDILSQMSARFNESREAEDLSLNPAKRVKLNDNNENEPMMLVKKDVVGEAIEEPISYVTGPGSGQDCQQGNSREEPQFSEAVEEPVRYVTGVGYGVDCEVGNPKGYGASGSALEDEEPEFGETIEEAVQYVVGEGSGQECDVGNPSRSPEDEMESNQQELEFSETIEEPFRYTAGHGSGEACEVGNLKSSETPEPSSSYSVSTMGIECSLNSLSLVAHEPKFSDVIEEPIMFVRGPGYGHDCLTGNPEDVDETAEDKSPEKKPKLWSIDTICSSERLLSESSGSSQKEPEALEGSKLSEGNGPVNSLVLNCSEVGNSLIAKVSDSCNSQLKPSSDIKPILENIPMKDKPPDDVNIDSEEGVFNINKNENNLILNDTNCLLKAEEPKENDQLETDKVSAGADVSSCRNQTSSKGDHTSDDIPTKKFIHNSKLKSSDQSSLEFSVFGKKSTSENEDGKSCSEDNSRSSVISGELIGSRSSAPECRENSNTSEDYLVIHSSEKERSDSSDVDKESSVQSKTRKSPSMSSRAEFDTESRSSIDSEKSDHQSNKFGPANKLCNIASNSDKPVDEEVSCKSEKSQTEKISLGIRKNNESTDMTVKNGSNQLTVSNCSVTNPESTEKTSLIENDASKQDNELENSCGNNPPNSDKSDEKLKNVMLTNIIEMCLDNDRDKAKSNLKGQLNAKFNDLFSAKNLLEPTIKVAHESLTNANGNLISTNTEKCLENKCTDENLITKATTGDGDIKSTEETSDTVSKEKNTNSKETESKHENGELVQLEEPVEDTTLKNTIKGRKSRTNSLNNDDENEIPNKIRKTESVVARRMSQRNTRTISQAETSLEPESAQLSMQIDSNVTLKEELTNEQEEGYCEGEEKPESGGNKIEETVKIEKGESVVKSEKEETDVQSKKEETGVKIEKEDSGVKSEKEEKDVIKLKEDNKEEEFNENLQKEVEDIVGKWDKDEEEEKDTDKTCDNQNKGFSLSSFSLEPPAEDGPILGKPPDFKALQSRKRRNSSKLSRSEDDGAERDEDVVEEAGGKKPKLRAKTRRSKGTPMASQPPHQSSSSSEDNQPEETSTVTPVKTKGKTPRRRGRPTKRGQKKTGRPKKSGDDSQLEKEEPKKTIGKKGAKKKQLPSRRGSETIEKKEVNKGKANSKSLPKKGKRSAKVETEEDSGNDEGDEPEDKTSDKDEADEETDGEDKTKGAVKRGKKAAKPKEDTDNDGGDEDVTSPMEQKNKRKSDEDEDKSDEEKEKKPKKKGRPKKRKTLLGLMESDLVHSKPPDDEGSRGMRQSRRIAQIKIKEQAERRAIEDATIMSLKQIKKKSKEEKQTSQKKQRNKKPKIEKESEEEDASFKEPVDEKKKGRKKKKKKGLTYDINKPWQSSSDSSSEEAEEEEEHFEEEDDEEDVRARKVVSDHEFSPESDLEQEETDSAKPVRRARTAKKADEEVEESKEADPCKKCGQADHPEWILLCDKCDSGYHASCLRPTLMLIPEGDWFCPPCQHAELVAKLKETLRTFEKNTKKRENEELRKKRLAYVGISLANVLPAQEKQATGAGRRIESDSSDPSSSESESSYSEDEEPVYQLRQRRAALQANYRFNDYDDLINSAIQDEMEAVKGAGNLGRGKDIANIVEAENKTSNEEGVEDVNKTQEEKAAEEEEQGENWRPPVVPRNTSLPSLRKKAKKLTDLDKHSDDDADSDEDFKGSSEEEEYSSSEGGYSDDSVGRRQPVRRSSRARTSRIDREFINDDSESSDEPRRKKTRKLWDSSSSESSDWGRRKRKATKTYNRIKTPRSGKQKKKKSYFDSDSDKPKKPKTKRPKIRYGLSEDDEEPLRRTRGKKMSYLEVAGSDTEEEVIARSRKMLIKKLEEEDEFVPEKEEVEPDEEVDEVEDDDEEAEIKKLPILTEKGNVSTEKAEQPNELSARVAEIANNINSQAQQKPISNDDEEDEDDEDDDQVEEEEIEEEIEEEVEEEEDEELEEGGPIEEAKNLVREKVSIPKPVEIIQPPLKIGSGISLMKVPAPVPVETVTKAIPSPVAIKEEKKEEKEERKEPTPAIRLVPSAKLLDPNKRRPPPDDGVIGRGMLGGPGYYRAQPMPPRRCPDQQRYLYPPHMQYYPGAAPPFYQPGEAVHPVGGASYDEQAEGGGGDEEGVFSGLVSYFSSQREDNLDS